MSAESLRKSRTGVFSATFADDFTRIMAKDPDAAPLQAAMGTTPSILPNRISWFFDLRGPSMHVDTACSGSMIAMDLACQAIRTGNASAVCRGGFIYQRFSISDASLLLCSRPPVSCIVRKY